MPEDTNQTDSLDVVFSLIKQTRDELKLQMHLAKADARDEYEKLEAMWKGIEKQAQPLSEAAREAAETGAAEAKKVAGSVQEAAESGAEQAKKVAGASLDVAARELQAGYAKLRKMLD